MTTTRTPQTSTNRSKSRSTDTTTTATTTNICSGARLSTLVVAKPRPHSDTESGTHPEKTDGPVFSGCAPVFVPVSDTKTATFFDWFEIGRFSVCVYKIPAGKGPCDQLHGCSTWVARRSSHCRDNQHIIGGEGRLPWWPMRARACGLEAARLERGGDRVCVCDDLISFSFDAILFSVDFQLICFDLDKAIQIRQTQKLIF